MQTDSTDVPLSPQESLDSDDVRNDDGDAVVDPPDEWLDPHVDESLDARLEAEEPDIGGDTPRPRGPVSPDHAVRHAEVVDGVIVEDSRTDRTQIDDTPEDGDSFFTIEE